RPGDYILARLLELSEHVDAALVIFGEEDKQWYHAEAQPQPRDNVLIEYGIFASRLGRQRTVVCRKGKPKNASDLGGLIFLQFGNPRQDDDAKERLRHWADALPDLIRQARKKETEVSRTTEAALPSGVDSSFTFLSDTNRNVMIVTGSLRD